MKTQFAEMISFETGKPVEQILLEAKEYQRNKKKKQKNQDRKKRYNNAQSFNRAQKQNLLNVLEMTVNFI